MTTYNEVQTTRKTFRIIEALKEYDGGEVTALAAELDMNKSTVHNHLSTLKKTGYVVQEGDTYHLGLKFLDLGVFTRSKMKLYQNAKPKVEEMDEKTGEMANLLIEEEGMGVYSTDRKGLMRLTSTPTLVTGHTSTTRHRGRRFSPYAGVTDPRDNQ